MKHNNIIYLFVLAIVAFTLPSCQKVINVNLNAADPKYVIEGNVTNLAGPYIIKITKTVNFDQLNDFPAVSGAVVSITDITANVADTLLELTPGYYTTSFIIGLPGHTYQLRITTNGKLFTASSTMPLPVTLDSLYMSKSAFGKPRPAIIYTDPISKGNYYYFAEYKNHVQTDNIYIRSDELINGETINQTLNRGGGESNLNTGDSLSIGLQCIDSAIYQYYYSLQQTKNQNAATPANPQTNITGGALGYFSAHTVSTRTVVVN